MPFWKQFKKPIKKIGTTIGSWFRKEKEIVPETLKQFFGVGKRPSALIETITKPRETLESWIKKRPEEKPMIFEVGAGLPPLQKKVAEEKISLMAKEAPPAPTYATAPMEEVLKYRRTEERMRKGQQKIFKKFYPERYKELARYLGMTISPEGKKQLVEKGVMTEEEVEIFALPEMMIPIGGMQFVGPRITPKLARQVLGVKKGASVDDIRKGFNKLVHRPDLKARIIGIAKDPKYGPKVVNELAFLEESRAVLLAELKGKVITKVPEVTKLLEGKVAIKKVKPEALKAPAKTMAEMMKPEVKPIVKPVIPKKIIKEAIVKPKVTLKRVIKPPKEKALRDLTIKLKAEERAAKVAKITGREEILAKQKAIREEKEFLESIKTGVLEAFEKEKNIIRKSIGFQRKIKNLSGSTMARLKENIGIKEWKNATKEQLSRVLEESKKLKAGDKFLTEKQLVGLKDYVKTFDNPRLVTQREVMERFRETEEILNGFITKRISGLGFPTVDVKEGHSVIRKVVDNADYELRLVNKRIRDVNEELNILMKQAEKASGLGYFKRRQYVGENVFKKMGGVDVKLTNEEKKVVDYLTDYFKKARKDLKLEKYRRNYITYIDKTFLEKLRTNKWNLIETIKQYQTKEGDIPLEIMLALDDIVGSEKFFRFALERKGIIDPTTNIRRILQQYSSILENKKALDKILPEGQAAMQLLLQPKSAMWMKKFLQNLKGRGLDSNFRRGKMGWMAKSADKIIDFGYIRLLGLNYMSAIKNIVGGEVNSLVFQTFNKYLIGKRRFILHPKKAHKFISDAGLLDGSYVDIIRHDIGGRIKKLTNTVLYGGMQVAEYEIRGTYFLGQLTELEFKTGIISPQRFRKIMDGIAITQGIYTKVDSPLFVQTVLGRSVMQFGRWKITNANLVRRISIVAKKEWAKGIYLGKNTQSLLKMFIIYGIGTYLSYEAGKAGWKRGKKIAEAGTELVDLFLNLPEETMRAIQENPMFQTLDSMAYTIQGLMSYIGLVEKPRPFKWRSGIEDLWLSPIERPKELLKIEEKKEDKFDYLPSRKPTEEKTMQEIFKEKGSKFDYLPSRK